MPEGIDIILHGENGSVGIAGRPPDAEDIFADAETFLHWESAHRGDLTDYTEGHKDLLDAGSRPITLLPGADYETGITLMERIRQRFYERFPNSDISFQYKLGMMSHEASGEDDAIVDT